MSGEVVRLLCGPPVFLLWVGTSIVAGVLSWFVKLSALRWKGEFSPVWHGCRLIGRLLWAALLLNSYSMGGTSSTKHAFLFLAFCQMWADVLVSLVGAFFAHYAPTDYICGMRADTLFGWYYLGESSWSNQIPRDWRTNSQLVGSSLFWVLAFMLKLLIEMAAVNNLTRAIYTLSALFYDMLTSGRGAARAASPSSSSSCCASPSRSSSSSPTCSSSSRR